MSYDPPNYANEIIKSLDEIATAAYDCNVELRDRLAMAALPLIESYENTAEDIARNAYAIADAMLVARKVST